MFRRRRRTRAAQDPMLAHALERITREDTAYRQAVAADAIDALARQADHDSAAGMPVSGRMLRQARDERAAQTVGDGSTWLPPGARPERPPGVMHPAHEKPPKPEQSSRRRRRG